MRIDELFNDPYNWYWNDNRGTIQKMLSVKTAAVTLGDISLSMFPDRPSKVTTMLNRQLSASFKVNDDEIWVMFEKNSPGKWGVVFDSRNNKLNKNKTYELTDAGHPGRILATVIEIIKDFLVSYEPNELHFTAQDIKRANIYKAIVDKIKRFDRFRSDEKDLENGQGGKYFKLRKYI